MGLFALASALERSGVDVQIINSDVEKGKAMEEILDYRALDAVGFDCHWVNQSLAVLETAELIKKAKPEVFIFLGGFTASLFAEEILLGYPQIDAIIRGDGDVPIVRLCEVLSSRMGSDCNAADTRSLKGLSEVPNLVWRRTGQELLANEFSYVATAEDMERLDFAAIDLLKNWEYYRKRSIYWTRFAPLEFAPLNLSPMFFLEIGRGCKNSCVFCGGNCEAQRIINNRRKVVVRSVDSVIETVRKAMSFGFRTFFTDFEFEGSGDWYGELFRRIKQEELDIHYVYSCWGLLSKHTVDALSEGFEKAFVQLSPETADVDLRRRNKGGRAFYTNKELRDCLDYVRAKGNVKVQLYFAYFLPFERPETVLSTIEFISSLLLEYPELVEIAYLPLSTDPGSSLFLHPEKMNVRDFHGYVEKIWDAYVLKEASSPDLTLFRPHGISEEEASELEGRIELLNYLFQSFRKSISYILKRSGSPEMMVRILREIDVPAGREHCEKMKKSLLEIFRKTNLIDSHLAEVLDGECLMQQRPRLQTFKARPQIWLDGSSGSSN
jgi:radical SAM superfamily enzyme YgiQ (UPF0313 family)